MFQRIIIVLFTRRAERGIQGEASRKLLAYIRGTAKNLDKLVTPPRRESSATSLARVIDDVKPVSRQGSASQMAHVYMALSML